MSDGNHWSKVYSLIKGFHNAYGEICAEFWNKNSGMKENNFEYNYDLTIAAWFV